MMITIMERGRVKNNKNLAVRWKAHDPSNELKTFALLDRAKNYNEYEEALAHFVCRVKILRLLVKPAI